MGTGLNEIRQADFSGGLAEVSAPNEFKPGQWSNNKGFVLEAPNTLRVQFACQRIGAPTNFIAVQAFPCLSHDYLVALDVDGQVWWTIAPDNSLSHVTTAVTTWHSLLADADRSVNFHFVTSVPIDKIDLSHDVGNENRTNHHGLLLTVGGYSGSSHPSFIIYEDNGDPADIHLATKRYDDHYPGQVSDGSGGFLPKTDVIPFARCGATWADTLLLGNGVYYNDPNLPLSDTNGKAYEHIVWITEGNAAGKVDCFGPQSAFYPGTADGAVVDLKRIDIGMLVYTTTSSGQDGLILLRGTPDNFDKVVLRAGLGAQKYGRVDRQHAYATYWSEAGTVVNVDHLGGIWATNGEQIIRLDGPELIAPSASTQRDHCGSVGSYLFVARDNRLLCMRLLSNENGSWTELVTPDNTQIDSLSGLNEAMYFVSNGSVYRYVLSDDAAAERGLINGAPITATLSTATQDAALPDGNQSFDRKTWFRVGVRARGNGSNAKITQIRIHAGAARSDAPSYALTKDFPISPRAEIVVPAGIGTAVEAAVTLSVQGDVVIEDVSFWVSLARPQR